MQSPGGAVDTEKLVSDLKVALEVSKGLTPRCLRGLKKALVSELLPS